MAIMKSTIIRPQTNLMLDSAAEIDNLCIDIKRLGITFFSHTRIFDDGSRIDLHNNAQMIEEFYFGKDRIYEFYTPEINPKDSEDDVLLLDNLKDNMSFQFLREGYNIAHMLVKIEKNPSYCDVWNFGTTRDNKNISNIYINHLDILTLFTYYYRDQCHNLIKKCLSDPIIIKSSSPSTPPASWNTNQLLLDDVRQTIKKKTHRYYINNLSNDSYLTDAEISCCFWICRGKTNDEIAIATNRSRRTIEKHVENMKNKLGASNRTHLIKLLVKLGLF
jgi:DNA-binding CsgD family transcriptional regulator